MENISLNDLNEKINEIEKKIDGYMLLLQELEYRTSKTANLINQHLEYAKLIVDNFNNDK